MGSSITLEVRAIREAVHRLERTMGGRFERTAVPLGEAAAQLRVSASRLSVMIFTGEIRVTRVERQRLVPVSEIERVLKRPKP